MKHPQNNRDIFELDIESMAHGGSGVGYVNRRKVLVPYVIPGERVLARRLRGDERTMQAAGLRLLDASSDRVYPRCGHFGPGGCWRCQWQHIDYAAQLLLKQDMLAEMLEQIGGVRADVVQPVLPSPSQWGYNAHMTFTPLDEGGLGLPAADETLIPIDLCRVLHPELMALYEMLDLEMPGLRRLKLQRGSDGARMMVLYLTSEEAPELETDLDVSINVLLPDNEPVNLVGESHVRYALRGRTFRVTAGSYMRANIEQIEPLVSVVERLLNPQPDDYILDLYAGVGIFAGLLAPRCKVMTAVESYPPAATDAEVNLTDIENVDVIEATVEAALDELDGHYDAAILDPSFGLGETVIDQLRALDVGRLVYVSGDMQALARDTQRLMAAGYNLQTVQPLDFAPHTYHLDAAALFVRN
jgi:23S rRNA (uracil1939-C5)-methyltransferase